MIHTSIKNSLLFLVTILLVIISISACGVKGPILESSTMVTKDAKS